MIGLMSSADRRALVGGDGSRRADPAPRRHRRGGRSRKRRRNLHRALHGRTRPSERSATPPEAHGTTPRRHLTFSSSASKRGPPSAPALNANDGALEGAVVASGPGGGSRPHPHGIRWREPVPLTYQNITRRALLPATFKNIRTTISRSALGPGRVPAPSSAGPHGAFRPRRSPSRQAGGGRTGSRTEGQMSASRHCAHRGAARCAHLPSVKDQADAESPPFPWRHEAGHLRLHLVGIALLAQP